MYRKQTKDSISFEKPQCRDIEEAYLCQIINFREVYDDTKEIVTMSMFSTDFYSRIFEVVECCYKEHPSENCLSVNQVATRFRDLKPYENDINEMFRRCGTRKSGNAWYYAKIIANTFVRRGIWQIAKDLLDKVQVGSEEPEEYLKVAIARLSEVKKSL